MGKKSIRSFKELQDRLNSYYSEMENSRISDITIHIVKKLLKDAQYLLMNLKIDGKPFHVDIKVAFNEEPEELYNRIIRGNTKYLNGDSSNETKSKKSKKKNTKSSVQEALF